MALEVRLSSIHGRGCFTTAPIPAGTRVIEYTGRRITLQEANSRYWERDHTYLLGLNDGTVIDGLGIASFINHCCDPNCRAEEDNGHVWFFAQRDLKAGEELTFDYKLKNSGLVDMPCYCGARNCRGSMFSAEELERRRQLGLLGKPLPRKHGGPSCGLNIGARKRKRKRRG